MSNPLFFSEPYEPDHPIWYASDVKEMLAQGIIDESDLADAEIIPDPE